MRKVILLVFVIGFSIFVSAQNRWSLTDCIDYAMVNNLKIIQNQYNKEVQDKNLLIAKRGHLPTLGGSIANNGNFGQNVSSTGLINRTDNFNNTVSLGANVLVYNHKRIEKQARKAGYDVEASMFDIQTMQNNITIQITQQYLTILLNKEIVEINESAMKNAQEVYDRAVATTDAGTTALTVLYEADAGLAREVQNVANAKIERDRSLFLLAQTLQLPNYKEFDIEDHTFNEIGAPLNSDEEFLNKAYETQPQLKAAESRIKSAETQVLVAKASYWPTVSASGGVGSNYYRMLHKNYATYVDGEGNPYQREVKDPPFFKQYKDNFSQQVSISADIPIFNQGITKLQVEQSKINEFIAKNNFDQEKQALTENVQQASFDVQANYDKYVAAIQSERSSDLALSFAQKSYIAGKSTIYDLSNARNNYVNAKGSVMQAKYNYIFSQKILNFYTGIPISLDNL